jgi:hypothetical protein
MKVVINSCFGGFGLSPAATLELWKRGGPVCATPVDEYYSDPRDADSPFGKVPSLQMWRQYLAQPNGRDRIFLTVFSPDESLVLYAKEDDEQRSNPVLVQLVEEMGIKASGSCAELKVVEIPDGVEFEIAEYDGLEHVAEVHRSWS